MKIEDALNRLNTHIQHFEEKKEISHARKAAEALCRILYLNSSNVEIQKKSEETKLQTLIEGITNQNLDIETNHIKLIKLDLNTLQTYGNISEHDNSYTLTENDYSRVSESIDSLLSKIFNSNDKITIDAKLPELIFNRVHKRHPEPEDWHCEKILDIVYPNRKKEVFKEKEYELHIVDDINGSKTAFIFLCRNISIKNALHDATKKISATPNLLKIISPKEISKDTGLPIKNRKEFIEKVIKEIYKGNFSLGFIEDFIWESCLPENIKNSPDINIEKLFVDQKIHKEDTSEDSLYFVDRLIKDRSLGKKPIHIIFGSGGVGKTTFCEQALQKINQHQDDTNRRTAIYISSVDIPDESTRTISSIQELYSLTLEAEEVTISSSNLALNLSCGNILMIIDGLDEIISKLKERFIIDEFIESIEELNRTYLNCTVIIASRFLSDDVFKNNNIDTYELRGFDSALVDKYIEKRLKCNSESIDKAKKYIREIAEEKEITPLIVRLICDISSDTTNGSKFANVSSKYLINEITLDKVVYQLIERDLGKQSISMTVDQYFEILRDVVISYAGRINKEDLDFAIEVATEGAAEPFERDDFKKIYISSLLTSNKSSYKLKYDSLELWVTIRHLAHTFKNRTETNDKATLDLISKNYTGGVIAKELGKLLKGDIVFIKNTIKIVANKVEDCGIRERKIISALLYIAFENTDKKDRTINSELLLDLFDTNQGDRIKGLSIYDDFYSLDFSYFGVTNGYFNKYTNLAKSKVPPDTVTFFNSQFVDFKGVTFGKDAIKETNFSNCNICQELADVIQVNSISRDKVQAHIKSDLKKILKIGFKQGVFTWKSEKVYKNDSGQLKSKISLDSYLDFLVASTVLSKEIEKGSCNSDGYTVAKEFEAEAKEFITQSLISNRLQKTIDKLTELK